MTGMSNSSLTITLIILILLSGLFSAIETAYSSASRIRLKSMDTDAAESVLSVLERYDRFISTVLIGNNIVNIASATIGTILFTRLYGDSGALVSTIALTVLVLLFGEIAPKTIAKQNPESFAVKTIGVVRLSELGRGKRQRYFR